MKLRNFVAGSSLVINQSPHGKYQNYKALDLGITEGVTQAPGVITKIVPTKDPKLSYFHYLFDDGTYGEYVHAKPLHKVGARLPAGEKLWISTWHHLHIAYVYKGQWVDPRTLLDRSIQLYWLKVGQKHPTWTSWNVPSYEIAYNIIGQNEMVKLQQPIKATTLNTVPMNIRKDPSLSAPVVGKVAPAVTFNTSIVTSGENVDGVNTWYRYTEGWISGKYVHELPCASDAAQSEQLAQLSKEIERLKQQNESLAMIGSEAQQTADKYKKSYDLIKLIQAVE